MRAWSFPLIEKQKAAIKAELDAVEEKSGVDARLKTITARIRQLADKAGGEAARNRYIYVLSALVHHLRHGGLSDREVKGLEKLAFAILEAQGIRPGVSRVSFLYGEIHLVKSQLAQKRGEFWEAAWETQIANRLGRSEETQRGFQQMAAGLRCLRTGNIALATKYFAQADPKLQSTNAGQRNRLGWLQALRLAGDIEGAKNLDSDTDTSEMSLAFQTEWAWERQCLHASQTGSIEAILNATRRKGSHATPAYQLESKLWAFAHQVKQHTEHMVKAKTLARKLSGSKQLARAVEVLEECYDIEYGLPHRLRNMVSIRDIGQQLPTIDKEMLLWLGAARWLERSKSPDLATMAFEEYRSLSLRTSSGTSEDILGIGADIAERLAP